MTKDARSPCALVTGAGAGLGREIALQLAARGCAVAILDIDAGAAQQTLALCRGKGWEAQSLVMDLTQAEAPQSAVAAARQRWGRLDILVNNAGYGAIEPFLDMTASVWDRTLGVNLKALALLCAAAGRAMRDQRSGRIVNVTSPASRMALPNYTAYAASKAGVDVHVVSGGLASLVAEALFERGIMRR